MRATRWHGHCVWLPLAPNHARDCVKAPCGQHLGWVYEALTKISVSLTEDISSFHTVSRSSEQRLPVAFFLEFHPFVRQPLSLSLSPLGTGAGLARRWIRSPEGHLRLDRVLCSSRFWDRRVVLPVGSAHCSPDCGPSFFGDLAARPCTRRASVDSGFLYLACFLSCLGESFASRVRRVATHIDEFARSKQVTT